MSWRRGLSVVAVALLLTSCHPSAATPGLGERYAVFAKTAEFPLPATSWPLRFVQVPVTVPLFTRPDVNDESVSMLGPQPDAVLRFRLVGQRAAGTSGSWLEVETLAGRDGYGFCDEALDPFAGVRLRFFVRGDAPVRVEPSSSTSAGEGDALPCRWMQSAMASGSDSVRMPGRSYGTTRVRDGATLFWRDGTPAGTAIRALTFERELGEVNGLFCYGREVLKPGASGESQSESLELVLCVANRDDAAD